MFYCSECGYKSVKWLGKCSFCGSWESFVEEKEAAVQTKSKFRLTKDKIPPRLLKEVEKDDISRITSGINELDRILGGGLVKGEIVLVGGEPGVGKSTLLLEACSQLSKQSKTLYVSAEESPQQVGLRAKRLDGNFDNLYILGEDNLETVFEYIKEYEFKFVVVDSIQVVYNPSCEGAKGSVSQIRGCSDFLTYMAKSLGIVIFVVGHVTKEGIIAGPKLLEHIVDCVLYFEGETLSSYRILRSIKNRFGPTGDIAVFEMTASGLKEVDKTTELFLPHRDKPVAGSSIVCAIEGLRPLLIELQALVSRASFGVVRRRSLGFDFNRFSLLIAIIEKRLKLSLSSEDVFLNVAGGLRIDDTATDLGAVISMISSYKDKEIPLNCSFIGEVGLAGELRKVSNINLRLKEAQRAGIQKCFVPESNLKEIEKSVSLKICGYSSLQEVAEEVFK